MADGMLALTWNNHSTTFFKTLSTVRIKERYTDVTLSCEGKFYQLHKLVLSTCSDYFEKIFEQTPCKHPVIVLRDVSCDELEALLNYMYLGSVSVAQNDLSRLIKVAELFQIKGLAVPDELPKNSDSGSYSNRKSDNIRDRSGSQRSSTSESLRTRPCASDSPDTPLPKRARTDESYASAEQSSQCASSVSHSKESARLDDRSQPRGGIGDNAGCGGSDVAAVTGIQGATFDFPIKEEIIHNIESDSDDLSSRGGFDSLHDPDSSGAFDPMHEESQGAATFIPKTEPEDVPPDEQSLTQAGLEQESYKEDALGMPGPSDAQGWYSEGEASGGLPVAKGSIGDESQEMLPLMVQQQQQMVGSRPARQYGAQESSGKKDHQCTYCPYSTSFKTNFMNHLQIHREKKTHTCPLCSASFASRSNFMAHLKTHTGEKPYRCPYCAASFAKNGNLKVHIRIHTGEKPFACPKCPHRATQKISLERHMMTHTRKESDNNF